MRPPHPLTRLLTPLALALSLTATAGAQNRVIYVNHAATGTNTGTSWADAYVSLHDALAVSTLPDDQIWVAQGSYDTSDTHNPAHSFNIVRPVQIYGGFDGSETSLGQRDPETHVTVLSGEIGTPAQEDNANHVLLVQMQGPEPLLLDGFHVVGGYSSTSGGGMLFVGYVSLILRNCTFTGHSSQGYGAALFLPLSSGLGQMMTMENCRFEGSRSIGAAGGGAVSANVPVLVRDSVFHDNESGVDVRAAAAFSLTAGGRFERCIFEGNRSLTGGKSPGGAIFIRGGWWLPVPGNYVFLDCRFIDNYAESRGGAMNIDGRYPLGKIMVRGCVFEGNSSKWGGGAIYSSHEQYYVWYQPELTIDRCIFRGNVSDLDTHEPYAGGGAIFGRFDTVSNSLFVGNESRDGNGGAITLPPDTRYWRCDILHCTFVNNRASELASGIMVGQFKKVRVVSSILWGNQGPGGTGGEFAQIYSGAGSDLNIQYSAIEDMQRYDGRGNTGAYPQFMDPVNGDFRLLPGSPLINRACPFPEVILPHSPFDLAGRPRQLGQRPDMGAYEIR